MARSPRSPISATGSAVKRGRNSTIDQGRNRDVAEPLNGASAEDVEVMIRQKANMTDLKHLMDIKSNKVDTEQNMRSIDILHK